MIVRFNASLETGEAGLSPASAKDLDEMGPLLAADIAKDILYSAEQLYAKHYGRMHEEFEIIRAKAQSV